MGTFPCVRDALRELCDRARTTSPKRLVGATLAGVALVAASIVVANVIFDGGDETSDTPITVEDRVLAAVAEATRLDAEGGSRRVVFRNDVISGGVAVAGFPTEAVIDDAGNVDAVTETRTGTASYASEVRSVDHALYTRFDDHADAIGVGMAILPDFVDQWLRVDLGERRIAAGSVLGFELDVTEISAHLSGVTVGRSDVRHDLAVRAHELTVTPWDVAGGEGNERRDIEALIVWLDDDGRLVELDMTVTSTYGGDVDSASSYVVHLEQWDFGAQTPVEAPEASVSLDEASGADPTS